MTTKRSLAEKLSRLKSVYRILTSSVKESNAILARSRSPESLASRDVVARRCLTDLLGVINATVTSSGAAISKEPALFVGNHSTYLDVPVLYSQVAVALVARYDLKFWPLFGAAARAIDTMFIKRGKEGRRKEKVKEAIVENIRAGRHVGVFPEGGTSLNGRPWKLGALALAEAHQIPVQPFRIRYRPARLCAYIDDDSFAPHLWNLLDADKIEVSVEFAEPFLVTDFKADSRRLEQWAAVPEEAPLRERSVAEISPDFADSPAGAL